MPCSVGLLLLLLLYAAAANAVLTALHPHLFVTAPANPLFATSCTVPHRLWIVSLYAV